MEKHFKLNDEEFERQFANCTLNELIFSHEAHLRLGWIYLQKYGLDMAISNICDQLQNYVKAVGQEDKYNKTLTIAAVKAVYHFMQKSQATNFKDFIRECSRLKYNFRELMGTHYKLDIYNSAKAKKEFIEPDLVPFD